MTSASYSSIWGLRSILMICEQDKIGEDGVLAEYLEVMSGVTYVYNP